MTLDELRDLVARITYKPGTTFRVVDKGKVPFVEIRRVVPCSRGGGVFYQQGGTGTLLENLEEMARWEVSDQIFGSVLDMEIHETWEWLRVDGELVSDPHRGEGA